MSGWACVYAHLWEAGAKGATCGGRFFAAAAARAPPQPRVGNLKRASPLSPFHVTVVTVIMDAPDGDGSSPPGDPAAFIYREILLRECWFPRLREHTSPGPEEAKLLALYRMGAYATGDENYAELIARCRERFVTDASGKEAGVKADSLTPSALTATSDVVALSPVSAAPSEKDFPSESGLSFNILKSPANRPVSH